MRCRDRNFRRLELSYAPQRAYVARGSLEKLGFEVTGRSHALGRLASFPRERNYTMDSVVAHSLLCK